MVWGAVIGAAASLYGAHKASSDAKKQMKHERQMHDETIGLQREGLDFSKNQYNYWKSKFDPVYSTMMSHITDGIDPNFNAIAADTKMAFQSSRDQNRRNMLRYGIRPQDGSFARADRESRLAESAAHVGVRNRARQASAGELFRRYGGIASSLQSGMTGAAGGVRAMYGNVGNAMGAKANMYGDHAVSRYNMRQNQFGAIGEAIGGVDWGEAWNQAKGWFSG